MEGDRSNQRGVGTWMGLRRLGDRDGLLKSFSNVLTSVAYPPGVDFSEEVAAIDVEVIGLSIHEERHLLIESQM
jgi:hypothetical protein